MRNLISTFLAIVCLIGTTNAQNKTLGVGTNTPNPNAALHVESPTNNQGLIIPRLTTAQRTSISPLASGDAGLMVYDSNLKSIYLWNGSKWEPNSKLIYPNVDTVSSAPDGSNLLRLIYTGSAVENVGVAQFSNLNPNNGFNTLFVTSAGLNGAGYFQVTNNNSLSPALRGITNSNQPTVHGVAGRTTGTGGSGGYFEVNNASSAQPAIIGTTNGSGAGIFATNTGGGNGFAGLFSVTNPSNTYPAIQAGSKGIGSAIRAFQGATDGTGPGVDVFMYNTISTAPGISVDQIGLGSSARFEISNASNGSPGLYSKTNGTGAAIVGQTGTGFAAIWAHKIAGAAGEALNVQNDAPGGFAINSSITNATNGYPVFLATSQGTGPAGRFDIINGSSTNSALIGATTGTGSAIVAQINNVSNTNAAIDVTTNGPGIAVSASNTGSGNGFAGHFTITNASNGYQALKAYTQGTGSAGTFEILNAANSSSALDVGTTGTGSAIFAQVNNAANTSPALNVETNGTNGGSMGIRSYTTGLSNAGYFETNNTSAIASTLAAVTNSTSGGRAFTAINNGTGPAGSFTINNTGSTTRALNIATNGTGQAIFANHVGASGDIAIFQSNSINVSRIDKAGQGFFNGGTFNSGADVAEMFDIEGFRNEYEPGDVLVISETTDRTVEKSNSPNSIKVVGVYATKPGVILSEYGIDDNMDGLVPMGVIGVIPTKVCLENGPIKRGDLLVTSSIKGHAMKAIPVIIGGVEIYPTGAILGKALENFEIGESRLIKVLVNVK